MAAKPRTTHNSLFLREHVIRGLIKDISVLCLVGSREKNRINSKQKTALKWYTFIYKKHFSRYLRVLILQCILSKQHLGEDATEQVTVRILA